jgi:hypothetical protein
MPDYIHAQNNRLVKKSLTSAETKDILYTLLSSPGALTSQQLIRKMRMLSARPERRSDKYIFERLKQLYPDKFELNKRTHLFNLNKFVGDFTGDKTYVRDTIIKLKRFLKLNDWKIVKEDKNGYDESKINCIVVPNTNTEYNHSSDEFKKSNSSNSPDYIVVYYESNNQICIVNTDNRKIVEIRWPNLSEDDYRVGHIKYMLNQNNVKFEYQIICNYDLDNDIHFYIKKSNLGYSVKYLDILLKDHIKINDPLIEDLYKKHNNRTNVTSIVTEMVNELMRLYGSNRSYFNYLANKIDIIFYNPANWKYEITLNGLLLYLYLEILEISTIEKNEINTKRVLRGDNGKNKIGKMNLRELRNIKRKILGLLTKEKILQICPFLLYNQDFKELVGLDPVEILLNITNQLFLEIGYYDFRKNHTWQNHLLLGNDLSHDSHLVATLSIPSKEENLYLLWNMSKRYFDEVEKHFQSINLDSLIVMHFNNKIKQYRERKSLEKLSKRKPNKVGKLAFGYTRDEINQYQTLFLKVFVYRLKMSQILKNLLIYGKKRLNESYAIWYNNYLTLTRNKDDCEHFMEPIEFKRLIDF